MSEKKPPSDYASWEVAGEGSIPLIALFPNGVQYRVLSEGIELLTPPYSRYRLVDGVVFKADKAKSTEPFHASDSERQFGV